MCCYLQCACSVVPTWCSGFVCATPDASRALCLVLHCTALLDVSKSHSYLISVASVRDGTILGLALRRWSVLVVLRFFYVCAFGGFLLQFLITDACPATMSRNTWHSRVHFASFIRIGFFLFSKKPSYQHCRVHYTPHCQPYTIHIRYTELTRKYLTPWFGPSPQYWLLWNLRLFPAKRVCIKNIISHNL